MTHDPDGSTVVYANDGDFEHIGNNVVVKAEDAVCCYCSAGYGGLYGMGWQYIDGVEHPALACDCGITYCQTDYKPVPRLSPSGIVMDSSFQGTFDNS